MKFSEDLKAQLIPGWEKGLVDYLELKKDLKKKLFGGAKQTQHIDTNFGVSIVDSIRSLVKKFRHKFPSSHNKADKIQVRSGKAIGGEKDEDEEGQQHHHGQEEEEQVSQSDELVQEKVKMFFGRLDEELNKVNEFYITKETEFLETGEFLNKWLQILLDLEQIPTERRRKNFQCCSNSDSAESVEMTETDATMRLDIPATASPSTISAVTSMLWEELANNPKKDSAEDFNGRKKFQCTQKMIGAFVELYGDLSLLKAYSSLNMVAFTKILTKFDKVSNQQASEIFLKSVKRSHFVSSDKVVGLMDEVKSKFTSHFANNDRKKAMKFLRPQHDKDSHMVIFFVGCSVTLFIVHAILAHLSGLFSPGTEAGYMENVYPAFSAVALLSLNLFMYGGNLFLWKSRGINYNFIFEFTPGTALEYIDAFLICTFFMTAEVGAMVIHFLLRSSGLFPTQVDAIPGFLLLFFVGLLIWPFNIFYRPTRYCFLWTIRNIFCSPLYKVLMVDFFMADQLTSQIPLLRHMESTACYFLARIFRTHRYETCKSGRFYRVFAYVISFAPYYWRAMQCARRWFDEYDPDHLANMGKYVSAMVAAGARMTYASHNTELWLVVVLVTSVLTTVYQLYWDFIKDWGLLKPKSKNPWLRDDLILKKIAYYISIAVNLVLRVLWVETVTRFNVGMLESRMLDFFSAALEVIRRGQWNFYRLENEHLKNVGKFRQRRQFLQYHFVRPIQMVAGIA